MMTPWKHGGSWTVHQRPIFTLLNRSFYLLCALAIDEGLKPRPPSNKYFDMQRLSLYVVYGCLWLIQYIICRIFIISQPITNIKVIIQIH